MATKVIDLLKDDDIRALTGKDTILAGHELWRSHEVVFGAFRPEFIEARVTGSDGTVQETRFELAPTGLKWSCTCSYPGFCAHLVAAALDSQREGRGDIYKAAGIIIKDRKMLVERSQGKPAFIGPGGRIEAGETAKQALVRELREEFQIRVAEPDLEHFGRFSAEAANHPGQQVYMETFLVKRWKGEIHPDGEIDEVMWLSSDLPDGVTLGSIFAHKVLPQLKQRGLID
jgi:8-oxo-dGTP diphosphatase